MICLDHGYIGEKPCAQCAKPIPQPNQEMTSLREIKAALGRIEERQVVARDTNLRLLGSLENRLMEAGNIWASQTAFLERIEENDAKLLAAIHAVYAEDGIFKETERAMHRHLSGFEERTKIQFDAIRLEMDRIRSLTAIAIQPPECKLKHIKPKRGRHAKKLR